MSESTPSKEELRRRLREIREGIRVTKITCTRSVRGRNGDSFVGFSATWQSVQSDVDLDAPEIDQAAVAQGVRLKDVRVARYLLAMECDVAALESAVANGSISQEYFQDAVRALRQNYQQFILREMGVKPDAGDE